MSDWYANNGETTPRLPLTEVDIVLSELKRTKGSFNEERVLKNILKCKKTKYFVLLMLAFNDLEHPPQKQLEGVIKKSIAFFNFNKELAFNKNGEQTELYKNMNRFIKNFSLVRFIDGVLEFADRLLEEHEFIKYESINLECDFKCLSWGLMQLGISVNYGEMGILVLDDLRKLPPALSDKVFAENDTTLEKIQETTREILSKLDCFGSMLPKGLDHYALTEFYDVFGEEHLMPKRDKIGHVTLELFSTFLYLLYHIKHEINRTK